MQEFYKGQKLYYRSGSNIKGCEIIGWSKDKIYVKLSDGRKFSGPKWQIGYSMFYAAQDLIEAERKRKGPKPKFEPEKKRRRSGKKGIERPPKVRGGDQYINGINSYGTRKQYGTDSNEFHWLSTYNNDREKYKDEKASGANGFTEESTFDGTGDYSREHKRSGSKKRDREIKLEQFNEQNYK